MRRLIQMDFEQSVILETSPDYFLRWLEAEAKALRWPFSESLEYREVGKTTLVTLQYPHTTKNKIEIEATATVEKDGEKVSYGQKWGVVIEFLTFQLNNNEIQLTGGYRKFPGIKDHFDNLWKEILNVFPKRSITEQAGAQNQESPVYDKRGRSHYTDEDKVEALQEWDAIDPYSSSVTLEVFLIDKFGEREDGSPFVSESTFRSWRSSMRNKGKYKQ